MKFYYYVFLCILFLSGCISREKMHLNEALTIIENKSIFVDSVNWSNIKYESFEKLSESKNLRDVNLIIKNVIEQLNDRHSMFWLPEEAKQINSNVSSINIRYEVLHDSIGYIEISSFSGFQDLAKSYSDNILKAIQELDSLGVKYWVIDLRNNSGGNMWPMISGISPFFENDTLGYVMDRNKKFSPWLINTDGIFSGSIKKVSLNDSYQLENSWSKIAILISEKTASAAEAVAISFKGLEHIKFFGKPTYGVSTANTDYKLNDGSLLILTTHVMADRNKKLYGNKILPDIHSENPKKDAIDWLLE